MALTERLAILIDANGAQAVSEFRKVGAAADKSLGGIEDKLGHTGAKMQSLGAGAIGVGAALTFGLTKAANRFGALEQAIGGTEAVFQNASGTINKYAEDSAEAMGLSERAFRESTTRIGGSLKGLGFDIDDAAKKSVELTGVAADLAATFGGTTAEAIDAIAAALRGEADPAERFNLFLNQTRVNAEAVALGLAKTTSEVDANAKAQAVLSLITKQSADAQGQFARESDTLAGKQQIANAKLEDAAAQLGAGFAPILAKVTENVADLATAFAVLDEKTGGVLSSIAGFAAVGLIVGGGLSFASGKVLELVAAYKLSTTAAEGATVANAAAGTSATTAAGGFSNLATSVGLAIAAFAIYNKIQHGPKDLSAVTQEELNTALHGTAEEIRSIEAIALGGSIGKTFFESLVDESTQAAARVIQVLKAAGVETKDFEKILSESKGSGLDAAQGIQAVNDAILLANAAAITATDTFTSFGSKVKDLARASAGAIFGRKVEAFEAAQSFARVGDAMEKSGGSARDLRGEQHSLEQATKSLTEAQNDLAEAELQLFLARLGPTTRDLQDADLDRADAALNLKDAINEVADAQRALKESREDGGKEDIADSTRDLTRAQLNLRRAQLANDDAQKAYNDTLNSGAEGSEKVKDAQENLKDAQERVADAQYAAESAQLAINEAMKGGTAAATDYGSAVADAVEDQYNWVEGLIAQGAPQSEINEAMRIAAGRIDTLTGKYGPLNDEAKLYLERIKEIANFEDANEVVFATGFGGKNVTVKRKDLPGYKPPYDLTSSSAGPYGMTSGAPAPGVVSIYLDSAVIGQGVVDWSQLIGGAPIVIRTPN